MARLTTLFDEGLWLKGNLHAHSTMSDGRLTPGELAASYREAGYQFLSLADHNRFCAFDDFDREDFLMLPGVEMSYDGPYPRPGDPRKYCHIVGLDRGNGDCGFGHLQDIPLPPPGGGSVAVNGIIRRLNEGNLFTVLAHPWWSHLEWDEVAALEGFVAIEVFNNLCQVGSGCGYSETWWDCLLRRGRRVWGVATDDTHQYMDDRFGGFVRVKARSFTKRGILEALEAGSFHASQGPEIYRFEVVDGEVWLECSPAEQIFFIAYDNYGAGFKGEGLTRVHYPLNGDESYLRAEVVDARGRKAWANPIFLRP